MALIVHKYGGTSMGSTERIRNVAKRVAKWRRRRALSKLPLVPKRWALDAHVARQAEAPFLGTTATVEFMRSACEAAGLRPAGTKGEGTLFAWIWAQAEG